MPSLFDPIQIGDVPLDNRIVMAPLTRSRAGQDHSPTDLMVEYYRQRSSAGLIISEATQISPMGQGYLNTPGIYLPEHVAGWRAVTEAVHAGGGRMFLQLWHVGRISHTSLLPDGQAPVSSSNQRADAQVYNADGFVATSQPRALADDELPELIDDYRQAAIRAMAAGCDGVEVHSANNYLLEQFLRDSVNDRSGPYGGSIANRCRLVVEVMQAIAEAVGPGRVGIRLSPMTTFNGTPTDSDPQALYGELLRQLAPLGLAYVHMIEGETGGARDDTLDYAALREAFGGTWMVNNGYDRALAMTAVESGRADLVCFGRPFISNPDLVRRLKEDAPLNDLDADTLYGGGAKGYTDYPTLLEQEATA